MNVKRPLSVDKCIILPFRRVFAEANGFKGRERVQLFIASEEVNNTITPLKKLLYLYVSTHFPLAVNWAIAGGHSKDQTFATNRL